MPAGQCEGAWRKYANKWSFKRWKSQRQESVQSLREGQEGPHSLLSIHQSCERGQERSVVVLQPQWLLLGNAHILADLCVLKQVPLVTTLESIIKSIYKVHVRRNMRDAQSSDYHLTKHLYSQMDAQFFVFFTISIVTYKSYLLRICTPTQKSTGSSRNGFKHRSA